MSPGKVAMYLKHCVRFFMVMCLVYLLLFAVTVSADQWAQSGPTGVYVNSIAVDPVDATVWYIGAGNGIFRSDDAGLAWAEVNTQFSGVDVTAIVINPLNAADILLGTSSGEVYRSVDGGNTWTSFSNGLPLSAAVSVLLFDPKENTTIYAVSNKVYRSTAGSDWTLVFNYSYIGCLVIDPTNTDILYAGMTYGAGVFRSIDRGDHWTGISTGLTNKNIRTIVLDPALPSTLYCGTEDGLFKTIDSGENWIAKNSGLTIRDVQSILIDPLLTTRLFAGTYNGGVFVSTTGGNAWSAINTGMTNPLVTELARAGTTPPTILSGTRCGIFTSTDNGAVWSSVAAGLYNVSIMNIAVSPVNNSHIYATSWNGGVFRSTDGGTSWTRSFPAASPAVFALALHPDTIEIVYAGVSETTFGGKLWRSSDSGGTWVPLTTGLPNSTIYCVAMTPGAPQTMFVANSDGMYKSVNGGTSWGAINNGLPATSCHTILIQPNTPDIMYVGTASNGVYKSVDAGQTWQAANAGMTTLFISSLIVNPAQPSILYAATWGQGVFRSDDAALTWQPMNSGLTDLQVRSLAIHRTRTNRIYAGTYQAGIFRSEDGGSTWALFMEGLNPTEVRSLTFDLLDENLIYAGTTQYGINTRRDTVVPVPTLGRSSYGYAIIIALLSFFLITRRRLQPIFSRHPAAPRRSNSGQP